MITSLKEAWLNRECCSLFSCVYLAIVILIEVILDWASELLNTDHSLYYWKGYSDNEPFLAFLTQPGSFIWF